VRETALTRADDPDRTNGLLFEHPVNRTSKNGVTGAPSRASLEKGQRWFNMMVDDLSAAISRGQNETPPLPHSYFSPVTGDTQ
jgi:creatinine amidohydrolase